jgi:hypothetical protein
MPDITGSIKATFVATINSGKILKAALHVPGTAASTDTDLVFTDQTVTVDPKGGLPAGQSEIQLAIAFDPGDPNATIGLGKVMSGNAKASVPPGTIDNDGHGFGVITLVGGNQ